MEKGVYASIVTFHTDGSELTCCLDTLCSCSDICHIDIIDNASEAEVRDIALRYDKVDYIPSENIGYGRAHNIALRRSMATGADYHLVLNTDLLFSSGDLSKMVDYMEEHMDVGALQPEIVNADGTPQYTVRLLPSPTDLIIRRFMPDGFMADRKRRYELRDTNRSKPFNVPYHQGSFMLLRTEALYEAGIFDERFFMYPEDIDLTRRIHRNWKTIYYPYVTIIHNHRRASYHSLRMTAVHAMNMIKYFNKWGWIFDNERKIFNRQTIAESSK